MSLPSQEAVAEVRTAQEIVSAKFPASQSVPSPQAGHEARTALELFGRKNSGLRLRYCNLKAIERLIFEKEHLLRHELGTGEQTIIGFDLEEAVSGMNGLAQSGALADLVFYRGLHAFAVNDPETKEAMEKITPLIEARDAEVDAECKEKRRLRDQMKAPQKALEEATARVQESAEVVKAREELARLKKAADDLGGV